jgi:pseudaminic acid cytidylyltransferase
MNVAIIPARGGSKRIPRKNIRDFCGQPMIAWTIEALRESGCFDRIVVSTDDDEIMGIAAALGADLPFRRPPDLADDHAATLPVIAHAVGQLKAHKWPLARVCCAYATAPLLSAHDLRQAAHLLDESGADYVFSCATFAFPIRRALQLDERGGVEPVFPEFIGTRSQDLRESFHDAGQFYWGKPSAFESAAPIFGANSRPYMIPRHRVQDIDTLEDWTRAELLFRTFGKELST